MCNILFLPVYSIDYSTNTAILSLMQQPEVLYLVASIAIVVLTAFLVYLIIELVKSLKILQSNLALTEDTLKDVVATKNGIKSGVLGIVITILNSLKNGGEKIDE